MSSLHKQFKMNTNKEEQGVAIKYDLNEDGTIPTFFVRRQTPSNQLYAKTLEREMRPYRRKMQLGTLDNETSREVMMRTFVGSILVRWEGVQNQKNELIPFTFENAMQLFKELPDLYQDLFEQSSNSSLFRAEELEGDAKNS